MAPLLDYPLRFQPLFRRYLWGGRRLATVLGKPLGEGDDYAESWEVVDHGEDQSVVLHGKAAGQTLHQLVAEHGGELFGDDATAAAGFPLLMKFLDANRTLSVQVHPTDAQAARLDPPDLGKTEAWVVLAAEPGSKIYAGLRDGVTRDDLQRELDAGTCQNCLHQFEPAVGDCVFLPAGTVHAIGAGLVIAEIQQASDTTFRLFDWNRVDANGQPRALHIDESLAVIDYDRGPVSPQTPEPTDQPGRERLVTCEKFLLDRCTLDGPLAVSGDGRFHLIAVVDGSVEIVGDPAGEPLQLGQTALLPATMGPAEITPDGRAVLLDIRLP